MSTQNLIHLAKQGDSKAISELINHTLRAKGISAKVSRKGTCLRILLQAEKVPGQRTSTDFIHNGITKLGVEGIRTLQVLGQQLGDEIPSWSQSIELSSTSLDTSEAKRPVDGGSHGNISTSAKVVNPTIGDRLKVSVFLVFAAPGFLIIPFIGWIISAILLLIAVGALLQLPQYKGNCPYCSSEVTAGLQSPGVDCPACKKRILVKEERFWQTS